MSLVLLLLSACSGGSVTQSGTGSGQSDKDGNVGAPVETSDEWRKLLHPSCDDQGESFDAVWLFSDVGRWIAVKTLDEVKTEPGETSDVGGATVNPGGIEGKETVFQVDVNTSVSDQVLYAVAHGWPTYLAVGSRSGTFSDDTVRYVVVLDGSGDYVFPGTCALESLEGPLRSLLGDTYHDFIRGGIGLTADPLDSYIDELSAKHSNPGG